MFVGHYGASFAAKKVDSTIPLWVLFLAVQWLDVIWAPLVLLGVEKVRIVPGYTATNPLDLYYMPYTHSLVAAVLWSVAAAIVYRLVKPRSPKSSVIVGLAVFSHWVLDFIVHVPDLPLYDNTAKVGLGLWNLPVIAYAVEALLLFGGIALYASITRSRWLGITVFGVAMLAIHTYMFFGPPPTSASAAAASALVVYGLFAFVIWLLADRAPAPSTRVSH